MDWLPTAPTLAMMCLVLFVICAMLVVVLWSTKRHRDPRIRVQCDAGINALVPSLAALSHGVEVEGNSAEIIKNGAFFDIVMKEIARAKKSIHFESFLWKQGKLGGKLVEAFCERARAGVIVRVLVDAKGCDSMGESACKKLQKAGVKFARFHPLKLRYIGVVNQRDHRKILVIDGKTAFVGGHCIVDTWMGEGDDKRHYRDLSVRLQGPAVHQVQSTFSENWVAVTGELFAGEAYFPKTEAKGDLSVHVASMSPSGSAPAVKILHHMVICTATKRLWIQNPYFLPEIEAIDAMGAAVKRGVDVRVMVPSAEASDMPMVQHAAHRNFDRLLKAGVRIFEFPTTLLHQKVMTVDGVWSAVGSTNFDDRSFEINDEITLGIHGKEFAKQLEDLFEEDSKVCQELDAKEWEKRGALHKMKDNFYYLFNEML
ncbi:MAG: phospholipase D-like domain-containing protein [Usitatibacter sp.]